MELYKNNIYLMKILNGKSLKEEKLIQNFN
jgi:hypothetical protein